MDSFIALFWRSTRIFGMLRNLGPTRNTNRDDTQRSQTARESLNRVTGTPLFPNRLRPTSFVRDGALDSSWPFQPNLGKNVGPVNLLAQTLPLRLDLRMRILDQDGGGVKLLVRTKGVARDQGVLCPLACCVQS